jgi:hypothetical protein
MRPSWTACRSVDYNSRAASAVGGPDLLGVMQGRWEIGAVLFRGKRAVRGTQDMSQGEKL